MKRKRYKDEQIAFAMRQADNATAVEAFRRKFCVSEPNFYWSKK